MAYKLIDGTASIQLPDGSSFDLDVIAFRFWYETNAPKADANPQEYQGFLTKVAYWVNETCGVVIGPYAVEQIIAGLPQMLKDLKKKSQESFASGNDSPFSPEKS